MRPGRRLFAALLACCMVPGIAAAQDQCRAIRAITNMDGRRFADVAVGYAANPWRLSVRVGRVEALPTPDDCNLSARGNEVMLSCDWAYGDFATNNARYTSLFNSLQACLGNGLTPATGPRTYSGSESIWLKESASTLPSPGGETLIELTLIETHDRNASGTHYVTLSITYEPGTPGE
jgi:hypothetical protein